MGYNPFPSTAGRRSYARGHRRSSSSSKSVMPDEDLAWLESQTTAMNETQARAAADRARALELVGGVPDKVKGSPEYSGWVNSVKKVTGYSPISAAEVLSGKEYSQWQAQVKKLTGYKPPTAKEILSSPEYTQWKGSVTKLINSPEAITPEIANYIYESAKVPIKASSQAQARDIQQNYYTGGGAPGGAMLDAIQQTQLAETSQLGKARTDIEVARAERRKEDERAAIAEAGKLGTYAGDVRQSAGRDELSALIAGESATAGMGMYAGGVKMRTDAQKLNALIASAQANQGLGEYSGGLEERTAGSLADILGNTITAVPQLPASYKTRLEAINNPKKAAPVLGSNYGKGARHGYTNVSGQWVA